MKKIDTKNYNTTELPVETSLMKNFFHRDQIAHYFRWAFVGHLVNRGHKVIDFGCGKGELARVMWSNRAKPSKYIGLDIKNIKEITTHHGKKIEWAEVIQQDLIKPTIDLSELKGNKICSFEVLEHVGKQNVDIFLQNFKACGTENADYYLSTPNHNGTCAGNHTYDSGDGRGIACQEFTKDELKNAINKNGFEIIETFGTFASQRDYKEIMEIEYPGLWDRLDKYYYHHIMAVLFAPMYPDQSRNIFWHLKQRQTDLFTKAVNKGEW